MTASDIDLRMLRQGIDHFNRGHFFDAHEAWEDVWRSAPAEDKKFFQGLTQLAVAFHHHSTGNIVGACSVMQRGLRNVANCPCDDAGIDLRRLLADVSHWLDSFENGLRLPPYPQVHMSADCGSCAIGDV